MKKVMIAIPCMDMVACGFAQSLATLTKVGECSVSFVVGSLIYDSRNKLVEQALKLGADYVMWFDSDMIFQSDTLIKLMNDLDDGKDFVSGLYFRRTNPFTPVLFKKLEVDENGEPTHEGYDDYPDEIFEIAGCGFGCVLMKTDMLIDMANEYGAVWFAPIGNIGEDCAFCIRARNMGYKLYCDPNVKLGHMGHNCITEGFYKTLRSNTNGND